MLVRAASWTMRILLLFVAAVLATPLASAGAQRGPLSGFDNYITTAMRDWKVPGLAIAIVRNDTIIHMRGYGTRTMSANEPVDEHTIFAVGSTSKAFTATLVGMLVDEGKLRWDDAAHLYLPGLELFDPYVSKELTVRDLLSHRSGLARGDLIWYATDYDRRDVLRRVRFLKPAWSVRARFGYQNIMYLAAGEVASSVSGRSWDDLVRERIFSRWKCPKPARRRERCRRCATSPRRTPRSMTRCASSSGTISTTSGPPARSTRAPRT
jgi:CubicO group peptidase (beta-lactamase class C family)